MFTQMRFHLKFLSSLAFAVAFLVGGSFISNTAHAANPLVCFDGTTDTGYGGICTLVSGGATLDNSVPAGGGDYSGVSTAVSSLSGKTLAQVGADQLSFTYTGIATGGAPRISLPIDSDANGTEDGYAFIGANLCNNGAGLVDAINDPTCDVNYLSVDYPNWAAFAAAFPAVSVASNTVPFIIADEAGTWTVSDIHLGSEVADNVVTNAATGITSTDATLNGTNGPADASQESFWVSLAPIDTSSSSIPSGVYSTPVLPPVATNGTFSDSLSLVTTSGIPGNMPAITPATTYYFVAWSNVGGTWYHGDVLNFTTSPAPVLLGTLVAEDFGVNSNVGLGQVNGYATGFGLTDATFDTATSIVVKLYAAEDVLLQTNTATAKVGTLIGATAISSPFDVSGSFNYATDGYWTNVRAAQYGQSVPAVKVVATVTLANGKVVTATNTTLTGDATTIYPVNMFTLIYTSGANGTITGTTSQAVGSGLNGTTVTAVANSGYHFVNWTGTTTSTTNPRTDTNVIANISVTANFAANGGGGGSSGGSRPVTPAVPANVSTPDGCEAGNKFSTITGRNCNAATPAVPAGQVLGASTQAGQVLGASKFTFTLFVKDGSNGSEIIELQNFLNTLGYTLVADGKFGPKTKGAVIKFQITNKLKGDGIVGPMTRAILNK